MRRVLFKVLKKSIGIPPLIDIETATSLSSAGAELTGTEFNRIPPLLALQIMDDMFARDYIDVSLHRQRFNEDYHEWLKRDRDLRDKHWLIWHQKQRNKFNAKPAVDENVELSKSTKS